MNHQAILTKAVEKAIKGGWNGATADGFHVSNRDHDDRISDYGIIYSHDFAKALWGEDPAHEVTHRRVDDTSGLVGGRGYENWQYHLRQMVIADDAIKYLGENI